MMQKQYLEKGYKKQYIILQMHLTRMQLWQLTVVQYHVI